jgi:hypothetical protein
MRAARARGLVMRAARARGLVMRAAALALAALAACHHGGDAADPRAPGTAADPRAFIASIAVCTTTETELRAQLGAPTRDGRLAAGRIMSWIVAEEPVVAYVAVLLDDRGTVVDLYWDVPSEIPWTPVSHCAPAAPPLSP